MSTEHIEFTCNKVPYRFNHVADGFDGLQINTRYYVEVIQRSDSVAVRFFKDTSRLPDAFIVPMQHEFDVQYNITILAIDVFAVGVDYVEYTHVRTGMPARLVRDKGDHGDTYTFTNYCKAL